jgi:hypothetical protein
LAAGERFFFSTFMGEPLVPEPGEGVSLLARGLAGVLGFAILTPEGEVPSVLLSV